MSWFFLVLLFSFIFGNFSEGSHHQKQSAVVVGTVYCDTCFQEDFSRTSHFISGASVAVECKDGTSEPGFRQEVKTNENGEFKIDLPFSVSKHVKKIKGCSVKLIRSSEPYCGVASTASSSSLHLKSRKHGTHIFSAGFFTFKPLKQPILCNQKPSVHNPKLLGNKKTEGDSILKPPILFPNQFLPPPIFPPNPFQPPPLLPPLLPPNPFQPPPAPLIPNPFQPPPAPLIPNPFQPPPAPLIPNPFQPAPAPVFPPNPFMPPPASPAPLFPFPPIPGLTPPSPPPPSPPFFPFPLPPFPFPPIPPFPGIPPALTSPKKSFP
ncbi:hypothetical protein DITRI_Ditri11bG0026900 [Diplodiscus trichospermus]